MTESNNVKFSLDCWFSQRTDATSNRTAIDTGGGDAVPVSDAGASTPSASNNSGSAAPVDPLSMTTQDICCVRANCRSHMQPQ